MSEHTRNRAPARAPARASALAPALAHLEPVLLTDRFSLMAHVILTGRTVATLDVHDDAALQNAELTKLTRRCGTDSLITLMT